MSTNCRTSQNGFCDALHKVLEEIAVNPMDKFAALTDTSYVVAATAKESRSPLASAPTPSVGILLAEGGAETKGLFLFLDEPLPIGNHATYARHCWGVPVRQIGARKGGCKAGHWSFDVPLLDSGKHQTPPLLPCVGGRGGFVLRTAPDLGKAMKSKGFTAKYGVTLVTMNAFLRSAGVSRSRGSIGDRIKTALASYGVTPTTSLQAYCVLNAEFIREKAACFKAIAPKAARSGVVSDAFLSSYAWRRLRMEALIKYGRCCMCCGATPETGAVMNVDHIKPRRLFPDLALEIDNLQVLCHECNHGKGNWDQTDWRRSEPPGLSK